MNKETAAKLAAIKADHAIDVPRGDSQLPLMVTNGEVSFLLRIIDELTAERDEAQQKGTIGQLVYDMILTHCPPDDLPREADSDFVLNGWLRMRAARDEALADVARLTAERDAAAAKRQAEIVAMLRTESRQWTEDAEGKANRGDFHNAVGSNHRAAALSDMADELENDAIEADAGKGAG